MTSVHSQDFAKVEIETTQLNKNFYVLKGFGGNILVMEAEDEFIVVDSQFEELGPKIEKALKAIHPTKKISYLLNTHWHRDHVGGNSYFRDHHNATVVAHENVYKRTTQAQENELFQRVTDLSDRNVQPDITFSDEMQLRSDEPIWMMHVHNAHTDGDALVYFPQSNIIHMGDCLFYNMLPYLDISSGGSIEGYKKAQRMAMMLIDNETIVVPGHGEVTNKMNMIKYSTELAAAFDEIQKMIKKGYDRDDIISNNKVKESYDHLAWSFINLDRFVDIIFLDSKNNLGFK